MWRRTNLSWWLDLGNIKRASHIGGGVIMTGCEGVGWVRRARGGWKPWRGLSSRMEISASVCRWCEDRSPSQGRVLWRSVPCPLGDFPHNFPEDEELPLQLPTHCPDSADPNPLAPPPRNMLGINYSSDFDSWNSLHCQALKNHPGETKRSCKDHLASLQHWRTNKSQWLGRFCP